MENVKIAEDKANELVYDMETGAMITKTKLDVCAEEEDEEEDK